MTRFIVVVLFCICLAAAGCTLQVQAPAQTATDDQATQPGVIRFYYNTSLDMRDVPMLMALDAMLAQGHVVETTSVGSSNLTIDALARGDGHIGSIANQSVWAAIEKGADVRTIAQRVKSTVIVLAKTEIQHCSQLDGRPVAAIAASRVNSQLLSLYLEQNCPEAEPEFIDIADSGARLAALIAGAVDATVIDYGFLLEAESQAPGQFHALVSLADEFPELQTSGIHVYQPWAEENPELVQGFVRALVEAQRRIYEEPEALYAAAVDHLDLDPEFAKELADAYLAIELWDRNGALTEENLQYTLDFLGDIEAIPAGLRTEDVAELSYLNSVLDELGRQ